MGRGGVEETEAPLGEGGEDEGCRRGREAAESGGKGVQDGVTSDGGKGSGQGEGGGAEEVEDPEGPRQCRSKRKEA